MEGAVLKCEVREQKTGLLPNLPPPTSLFLKQNLTLILSLRNIIPLISEIDFTLGTNQKTLRVGQNPPLDFHSFSQSDFDSEDLKNGQNPQDLTSLRHSKNLGGDKKARQD